MVSAAATLGYPNVRVADVVNRARVSRQSFYALFADKEECFLEAHAAGLELIVERLARWTATGTAADDGDPTAPVRGAVTAYLLLAADEPEFARCMLVELPGDRSGRAHGAPDRAPPDRRSSAHLAPPNPPGPSGLAGRARRAIPRRDRRRP
ncbi:MAG TPA: TetR/AcrR family transcriptional regulator [Solirubrobacteraceae bacterium]